MSATKENAGAKKEAIAMLRKMPDGATIAEMIDELKLLAALAEGEADLAAGRTLTQAEVEAESALWQRK